MGTTGHRFKTFGGMQGISQGLGGSSWLVKKRRKKKRLVPPPPQGEGFLGSGRLTGTQNAAEKIKYSWVGIFQLKI